MQANPRIGVVGVAGKWSTEQLVAAVSAHTPACQRIDLGRVALDLGTGRVLHGELDLTTLDAVVIKKLGHRYSPELLDRLEILHYLAARGVRVFSQPAAIMRLLDRLSCTVMLRLADIPMPDTVITENVEAALAAVKRFGQAILKPLYTSKARGMEVIEAGEDAREQLESFRAAGNTMLYIQKMIDLPGEDLGIAFLGGEYLGSYARVAHGQSWHTSSSMGGKYRACEPSPEIVELARRAQAPFELDFTSVDVVETREGPLVFEVSAFGGFRGLREASGIDAAQRYAEYVLKQLAP